MSGRGSLYPTAMEGVELLHIHPQIHKVPSLGGPEEVNEVIHPSDLSEVRVMEESGGERLRGRREVRVVVQSRGVKRRVAQALDSTRMYIRMHGWQCKGVRLTDRAHTADNVHIPNSRFQDHLSSLCVSLCCKLTAVCKGCGGTFNTWQPTSLHWRRLGAEQGDGSGRGPEPPPATRVRDGR